MHWEREGAAQGGGSPKLATAAVTVTWGSAGPKGEQSEMQRGADSPSLQVALLVPGSVAAITATCKRVQGGRKRERERQTQASAARVHSPAPKPWLQGWHE